LKLDATGSLDEVTNSILEVIERMINKKDEMVEEE
jgi:hypothetical protein